MAVDWNIRLGYRYTFQMDTSKQLIRKPKQGGWPCVCLSWISAEYSKINYTYIKKMVDNLEQYRIDMWTHSK